MGALKVAVIASAALGLTMPQPAFADSVADWRPLIAAASRRFRLPAAWIERVMRAESAGRTMLNGRPIVSRAGAMGLMQLMPGTWAEARAVLHLGADPFVPRDNILAGAYVLRKMYERFGYPGLFGAYNAGPARYAAHLKGGALPDETVHYLAVLTGTRAMEPTALFVALDQAASGSVQRTAARHGLFAIWRGDHELGGRTPTSEGGD